MEKLFSFFDSRLVTAVRDLVQSEIKKQISECSFLPSEKHQSTEAFATKHSDGWLDAKGARHYLKVSKNTFDHYRYKMPNKLEGSKVGGKIFYRISDIDTWVLQNQVSSAN